MRIRRWLCPRCCDDTDCVAQGFDSNFRCAISKAVFANSFQKICRRKPLFSNFRAVEDGVGTLVIILAALIAAGAGIGGGGVFVPVLILIVGLSPEEAIPVSQSLMFGASIVGVTINAFRKHPIDEHRSPIDLHASLILTPCMLLGTNIGTCCYSMMQ
jgi:hypothetical protein